MTKVVCNGRLTTRKQLPGLERAAPALSTFTQLIPRSIRSRLRRPYWWLRNGARTFVYRFLPQSVKKNWETALPNEVAFWEQFLAQRGGPFATEYAERTSQNMPIEPLLAARMVASSSESLAILDVGSGPLPVVGRALPGRSLRVVGVDPLADEYSRLLKQYKVDAPAQLVAGEAERLTDLFVPAEFNAVYSSNAIDHCHNPMEALRQMLAVCRPEGVVFLRHFENEGAGRAYRELHQWNLCEDEGALILWNPHHHYNVGKLLATEATLQAHTTQDERGRRIVIAILTKRPMRESPRC